LPTTLEVEPGADGAASRTVNANRIPSSPSASASPRAKRGEHRVRESFGNPSCDHRAGRPLVERRCRANPTRSPYRSTIRPLAVYSFTSNSTGVERA